MPVHEVLLSKTARKQLDSLSDSVHSKIVTAIASLAAAPRPLGCKKLKGYANAYRVRSGDYRIVYEVEDKVLRVLVIGIGHRKDIYK